MANANTQLQSILAQFAGRSDVSPDQESQLSATIASDPDLTQRLNQEAASGHLKAFVPGVGGSEPLTGSYDKASGIVTLPAFEPGSAPTMNLRGSLRLQEMSMRFANSSYMDANQQSQPVTQDMVTNLQATINSSPTLASEMKRAVTTAIDSKDPKSSMLLENFSPLNGTVAGGTFNPTNKTMSIPPITVGKSKGQFTQLNANDLTFVLGHETQHAFNQVSMASSYRQFDAAVTTIAKDNNPVNDYTLPIEKLINSAREDEAKAQIAGWNALIDRERQTNPAIDLNTMRNLGNARLDDFIEASPTNGKQTQARPGITFNQDGSLPMTPQNISAQATYYFDKPPQGAPGLSTRQTTGIGFHGDSDYPNYYGAGAVSRAIAFDRAYAHPVGGIAPQMQLDMQRLHFKEPLLERNGITLPPGTTTTPQIYWDTSTNPPTRGLLQHTQGTHQHISPIPDIDLQPSGLNPPGKTGQPDNELLEKIRSGVRSLDQQAGKSWDESSERLSASLLLMATEKGFTAKDDLKFAFNTPTEKLAGGEILHMWREGHHSPDPAAHRAHMTTQEALAIPADQRLAQMEVMQQTKAQEIMQAQQQETMQTQSTQARSM
ncbi:XVIPCD domain-containing protein [Xanthomonas citri]|uniref:XVIPCD domain-containing protein n=5 Tax=Xanthomonas TaxID=338 RepID=UPI000C08D8F4|nr:XVIPCD domain-containing protein [Xanthomonas citri]